MFIHNGYELSLPSKLKKMVLSKYGPEFKNYSGRQKPTFKAPWTLTPGKRTVFDHPACASICILR